MTERDRVLDAFRNCITEPKCKDCPWTECETIGNGTIEIPRDLALAVMRELVAQEPRVMTPEEVNALDWDYCYLEQERLPGKEYRGMLGKHIMTCVTWPSITAAKISQGKDNYGRTWRCWTSRPTDEQREAVKWE